MSSRAYSLTVPPGTDPANTLHTIIQDKGKDMSERLVQGGHKITAHGAVAAAAENNDGKHAVGIDDNTGNAGSFKIYDTAGTTVLLEIYGTAHASKPGQIEAKSASSMKFVGINITSGTDPGHLHATSHRMSAVGFGSGAYGEAAIRLPKDCTITRVEVRVLGSGTAVSRTFQFRKTNGVPANNANILSDAIASVSIASVVVDAAAGNLGGNSGVIAIAALAGEWIVVKRTDASGGSAPLSDFEVVVTE